MKAFRPEWLTYQTNIDFVHAWSINVYSPSRRWQRSTAHWRDDCSRNRWPDSQYRCTEPARKNRTDYQVLNKFQSLIYRCWQFVAGSRLTVADSENKQQPRKRINWWLTSKDMSFVEASQRRGAVPTRPSLRRNGDGGKRSLMSVSGDAKRKILATGSRAGVEQLRSIWAIGPVRLGYLFCFCLHISFSTFF
jgi:hypothetical protein